MEGQPLRLAFLGGSNATFDSFFARSPTALPAPKCIVSIALSHFRSYLDMVYSKPLDASIQSLKRYLYVMISLFRLSTDPFTTTPELSLFCSSNPTTSRLLFSNSLTLLPLSFLHLDFDNQPPDTSAQWLLKNMAKLWHISQNGHSSE